MKRIQVFESDMEHEEYEKQNKKNGNVVLTEGFTSALFMSNEITCSRYKIDLFTIIPQRCIVTFRCSPLFDIHKKNVH